MSTYVLRKGRAKLSDLSDGAAAVTGYPGAYPGRVYYCNNVTGSTGASGLSWDDAFSTLDAAITASEAYRLALTPATNVYFRNTIYVQATATDYTAITAYPNYTDIIGVGADPRGNGGGIAVITGGASTDAAGGLAQRGNNWSNLQFEVIADGYWCFDGTQILRTTFTNCMFGASLATMTSGGGVRMTGDSGGVTFRHCHFGANGASCLVYGIYASAVTFNNCLIEDCTINAKTCGIYLAGCTESNTAIKRNYIWSGTSVELTTGISTSVNSFIAGNYIRAATAITGHTASNSIDNQVVQGGTAARDKA